MMARGDRKRKSPSSAKAGSESALPSPPESLAWLHIHGARRNNLKDLDVEIPLGRFVCITGVSGSGKSSLLNDIIREELTRLLSPENRRAPARHGNEEDLEPAEKKPSGNRSSRRTRRDFDAILGLEHLDKVIDIDQSPIGRTPRSNPATYIKVLDQIRDLYARLPDSRVRGYKPGRFSFNVATGDKGGGRCEACEGNGANRVEMDFLADVWVTCPVCGGRRFNHETLQIKYKGRSIADVLDMDVQEALEHFEAVPSIRGMLATLHDVGLDYLKLGQSSTTLSGGEAQRIKLARELVRRSTGRTLYLLDEPTTGLHFDDVKRLLRVLQGLVDTGNSMFVIEHNLDVIKTADWIIDLGPEGGDEGGRIVAAGTPEEVAGCAASYTGQALREILGLQPRKSRYRPAGGPSKQPPASPQASTVDAQNQIVVVGAREHNLKDITVGVPRGRMTVCSGVSGSGKSSFAIDTVYTEGQRRYVESLSAYARQFLGQLQKPRVDHIYGLSPAIAIEQQAASNSPRSTVGTVTEIYDYLRVLWARVGEPHCPRCRVPVGSQTSDEIVDRLMALGEGARVVLCAPIDRGAGEVWATLLERCRTQGYARARVDGVIVEISPDVQVDERRRHTVELVVDRVTIRRAQRSRLADSVEHGLALGQGVLVVVESLENEERIWRFSQHRACEKCGTSYEELTPHHFSFNSRLGWCPSCEGLGVQHGTTADAVILRPDRSLLGGAIVGWDELAERPLLRSILIALAKAIGFDAEQPCHTLTGSQRHALLHGLGERWIALENDEPTKRLKRRTANPDGAAALRFQWKGFFPAIDEATRISWEYRHRLQDMATEVPCQACSGGRIRPESAAARLGGRTIGEVGAMSLAQAMDYFTALKLDRQQMRIAGELLHEVKSRLRFLLDVGLGYLSLNRSAPTLSGGESQRIRLASQIGSGLTGVLYVLDEPTIGLHPRDNQRLIAALHKLRDLGNTLLLVEHDREVIQSADYLIDFGPHAGAGGGHVVAAGAPAEVQQQAKAGTRRPKSAATTADKSGDQTAIESRTGRYLAGIDALAVPTNRRQVETAPAEDREQVRYVREEEAGEAAVPAQRVRPAGSPPSRPGGEWLVVRGARQNNLQRLDAAFPLGRFICVTGVSGSGKSSLVTEILYPALAARLHRARLVPGAHERIDGLQHIDKVINVDQQPIGNSPWSNPATYTEVFDIIREMFARLPESRVRGYTAHRFSFMRPGGRCEDCDGFGQVGYEMHFMPDVWVPCETCGGRRYQQETLEVRYKGRSIADVLEMPVAEALALFENVPKVRRILQTLDDVGLGYLPLGQSAPTLSGGEAQRVKLARELSRPNTGRTVYLLDEPTTGLHLDDLRRLLDVLHRLVDLGNTVICIEHHLDVIKTADWVIDLGPEAGHDGGRIVVAGPPEAVAQSPDSHTGRILREVLAAGPHRPRAVYDPRQAAAQDAALRRPGAPILPPSEVAASRVKMPWERDGQRWHTQQRQSRDGQPVRWEGRALEFVIEEIERLGAQRLLPTDWTDRVRVEIKAAAPDGVAQAAVPWFLHALTGGRWLLDLLIRVPQGTFTQRALSAALAIKTLDERDDIEAYGQESRVQVRHAIGPLDQVRILVHDRPEIATPAFRSFLATALRAYFAHVDSLAEKEEGAEPWKKDGKTWHLSQKSIQPREPKLWQPVTLLSLLGLIGRMAPGVKPLWDRKVFVELTTADGRRVGRIITNKGFALRVDLQTPPGCVTPTQVEHLGIRQEFDRAGSSGAGLTFWFQTIDEIHSEELRLALQAAVEGAVAASEEPALDGE